MKEWHWRKLRVPQSSFKGGAASTRDPLPELLTWTRCGLGVTGPWQPLILMAQVANFRGISASSSLSIDRVHELWQCSCFYPNLKGCLAEPQYGTLLGAPAGMSRAQRRVAASWSGKTIGAGQGTLELWGAQCQSNHVVGAGLLDSQSRRWDAHLGMARRWDICPSWPGEQNIRPKRIILEPYLLGLTGLVLLSFGLA